MYLAVGMFLLTAGLDYFAGKTYDLEKFTKQIEYSLQKAEREINTFFGDANKVEDAAKGNLSGDEVRRLNNQLFTICIYEKDSLLFWSNNKVLPYLTDLKTPEGRVNKLTSQKNGKYEFIKTEFFNPYTKKSLTLIGLIPIFYDYPLENDYLKNRFALDNSIPSFIELTKSETDLVVRSLDDKPLFYLTSKKKIEKRNRTLILVLYLISFVFLGLFINGQSMLLSLKHGFWVGFGVLLVSIIGVRVASILFGWMDGFRNLQLFHPRHYAASDWVASLGDLVINILLVLWVISYFNFLFRPRNLDKLSKGVKYAIASSIYFIIISSIFGISRIFISLARNSEITLEFKNIFSLNVYSFIGLFSLTMLLGGLFLFSQKLIAILRRVDLSVNEKITFLAIVVGVFTLMNLTNLFELSTLLLLLFSIGFILLFEWYSQAKSITYLWLLVWLVIFSGFSTILLYNYNNEKEINSRRRYAIKLSEENDRITEFRFEGIKEKIQKDNFVETYFTLPFIPTKEVLERIEKRYIGGYLFNKYDFEIHTFNKNGARFKAETGDYDFYRNLKSEAQKTSNPYLYYWTNGKGASNYLADIPIRKGDRLIGRIVIQMLAKELKDSKVYPELLLDERLKSAQKYNRYTYAVYKDSIRFKENGKFYPYRLPFDHSKKEEFKYLKSEKRSHIIYKASDQKVVVVSKPNEDIVTPISLFSYMFCLQLLVLILIVSFNFLIKWLPDGKFRSLFSMKPTLRNRINFSVISIIIVSFVVIGVVTVIYFQGEFTKYHDQRLGRKVRGVMATVKVEMEENKNDAFFLPDIPSLSEIHNMDINLYDLTGDLMTSSQTEIVDKGLISNKIDPVAYFNLDRVGIEQYTQEEEISGLKFMTAYVPVRKPNGQKVGYLGLPYYSQVTNLREDVSEFMGTLLNVYVLLLILAGVVALAIGNTVTRPIQAIGEKLKEVKLGKENTKLEWENDDEIGALVTEYNKMINELEESADLLAQSNRETAWREMAKQVAHEIKNPLTPMKLSIQHLQRAATNANPEEVKALVARVSKTLVEQIDSLSNIASSFSNFAKMPKATNEEFNINHQVSTVYDLFSERDNMVISLEMPLEEYLVFADRNQMVRVFNNLIKNAIQAIPEDRNGEIMLSLYKKDAMVVVRVTDNGVGIPEDKHKNVFVPNFTTKSSGTGLGLAISRNIVESAAGKIYFETEVEKGTSFYVELPIAKKAEVAKR